MLGHVGVVAAASWAALGFAPAPALLALIAVSHFAIDWLKLRHGGQGFAPFALDQAGHLARSRSAARSCRSAWAAGLWAASRRPPLAARGRWRSPPG